MGLSELFGGNFFATYAPMSRQVGDLGADFSPGPAALMALYSELTYMPSRQIREELDKLPSDLAAAASGHGVTLEDARGFYADAFGNAVVFATELLVTVIGNNDRHIIIAHRGTANLNDVVYRDVDTRKMIRPFRGRNVGLHYGFVTALQTSYARIHDHVATLIDGKRQIFITGHSLGGAVAFLNGLEFKNNQFADYTSACYSFGAPRAATIEAQELVRAPDDSDRSRLTYYRIVRDEDSVPTLPPIFPSGYRHVGIEKYLERGQMNDGVPFLASVSSAMIVKTAIRNFPLSIPALFDGHRAQNYRQDLFRLAGSNARFSWDA